MSKISNAKTVPVAKPKSEKAKTAPALLTFNGKTYRKIDLENEWTLKQKKLAAPIAGTLLPQVLNMLDFEAIKQSGETVKITIPGKGVVNVSEQMFEMSKKIMVNMQDFEFETELLALIYIEKDEPRFNIDTYEQRKDEFDNMPETVYDQAKAALLDFFTLKLPLMLSDSQTYSAAVMQASQPK